MTTTIQILNDVTNRARADGVNCVYMYFCILGVRLVALGTMDEMEEKS